MGWLLLIAGTTALRPLRMRSFGIVVSLASLAWLAVGWKSPGVSSAVLFTLGLVFSTVCPVLVAHAALRYPNRRAGVTESVADVTAALETLAEGSPRPVTVDSRVDERLPQPVESAAYFAVVGRIGAAAGPATVSARRASDRLLIEIEDGAPPGDLVMVEDRVGALAGTVTTQAVEGSGTRIRVELPCGS